MITHTCLTFGSLEAARALGARTPSAQASSATASASAMPSCAPTHPRLPAGSGENAIASEMTQPPLGRGRRADRNRRIGDRGRVHEGGRFEVEEVHDRLGVGVAV